jgi:hypothetical protein
VAVVRKPGAKVKIRSRETLPRRAGAGALLPHREAQGQALRERCETRQQKERAADNLSKPGGGLALDDQLEAGDDTDDEARVPGAIHGGPHGATGGCSGVRHGDAANNWLVSVAKNVDGFAVQSAGMRYLLYQAAVRSGRSVRAQVVSSGSIQ